MRFVATGVQIREKEDGTESRTIGGKAICFGEETTIWDGHYYREREIISASCVTPDFLAEQDVKLNIMHNRMDTLCRNNKGEGTLKMEIKADGLYWEAEMPKCDIGDRALELVRNKTLTGCSFEFYADEYTEQISTLPDGREDSLITHTKFAALTALTIAMDPAYAGTSVSEREQFQEREKAADIAQKEAEKLAQREKETFARELAALQEEVMEDELFAKRESI